MTYALAIIGAGNMAEAIVRGLLRGGVMTAPQMVAADVSPQRRELFNNDLKVRALESAAAAAVDAPMLLLSVKPQSVAEVLAELKPAIRDDALVISIAAGVSTRVIEQGLAPRPVRVIRTMPNTPMLVGEGMVAMAPGTLASPADMEQARRIFAPAATVIDVTEDKLDAVTAVSGSGPAYFFYLVENMIRAGTEMGLTLDEAHTLATQTALGAARMLTTSGDSPQELRRKVTSPKGTTHAAITHMQDHGLSQIVIGALKAAERRSKELGA